MWSIRFLSGPLAGRVIQLKNGRNTVGRTPNCDVIIPDGNISKEHAVIEVYSDKVILTDSGSRNGTFVNGVQIQSHKMNPNEKIGFFDIIAEVGVFKSSNHKSKSKAKPRKDQGPPPSNVEHQPYYQGNVAYDQTYQPNADVNGESSSASLPEEKNSLVTYMQSYIDEVVLPGVYKLGEWMEFRTLLAMFVAGFIFLVTALSTIPLMRILKSSIEQEAQNRAQTIARALVRDNRNAIMMNQTSLVNVESARTEPGVSQSFVISSTNGEILAPPQMTGQYITDIPYVNEARKINEESVSQIDNNTIVAVAPIKFYNPNTGTNTVTAHTVVVYDMGALAVDDGKTLSLFVQILFIAILSGGILFFFLYKIILRPITALNTELDLTLKGNQNQVTTVYQFPEILQLASNINSAISRSGGGFAGDQLNVIEPDRSFEMQNIVQLIGFAAIAIRHSDRIIMSNNDHFINQIGNGTDWSQLSLDKILDQALKLNLHSLLDKVAIDGSQLVSDQLEIGSQNFDISAQAILGTKNISYVVVVFIPKIGGD